MAKEVKNPMAGEVVPVPVPETSFTLTAADLKDIVQSAVGAAVAQQAKASEDNVRMIADALLEARKPYKDPKAKENEDAMRASMRETQDRIRQSITASQDLCPHLQGCNSLSDVTGDRSSIVLHRLDTGLVIGICTNCQAQFFSDVPEHRVFFQKKSGNKMSAAGFRMFPNPEQVMKKGR